MKRSIKKFIRKAEETTEFKITKPRESFSSKEPIQTEGLWMMGLTSSEIYNSIFNRTEENNKFQLFKFSDSKSGGILYEKVREEIEND